MRAVEQSGISFDIFDLAGDPPVWSKIWPAICFIPDTMNLRGKSAEAQRLIEENGREKNWKRWGTYLAERQWGTVREDYSAEGDAWRYFPHDDARRRA